MLPPPPADPPTLADSPLYLLATLFAARRSRDRALERVTRRRLDALGIRITFGDELPNAVAAPEKAKGAAVADTLPLRPAADPPARRRRRPLSRLVVDARRLAKLLCAAIRTVRTWDAAGKLPSPIRIGGRVVWRVAEIRAWLAAGAPDRATWAAMRAARK